MDDGVRFEFHLPIHNKNLMGWKYEALVVQDGEDDIEDSGDDDAKGHEEEDKDVIVMD